MSKRRVSRDVSSGTMCTLKSGSFTGRDEDLEDTTALDDTDFATLMDTLAVKTVKKTSMFSSSGSLDTVSLKSRSNSAVINACNIPVLSEHQNNCNRVIGVQCSMQGNRPKQEDRALFVADLSLARGVPPKHWPREKDEDLSKMSLACIFDGHSGELCSDYLSKHVVQQLFASEGFLKCSMRDTLLRVFSNMDEEVCTALRRHSDESGSTGTIVIVDGRTNELYLSNVGDSVCVLCKQGRAVPILAMHRPSDIREKERVEKAGGKVINNRVNGILAISRAFGDVQFKSLHGTSGLLCSIPDIVIEPITGSIEFAVIASDGLWDVMDPQTVVNFVRKKASTRGDMTHVVQDLVQEAYAQGSVDNVTVMILVFNVPREGEKKVKDR